ncbi:hypothetical protein [Pseudomonas fluorescens]|jgi:hypothetical protein|uniref:hypothetical protein n=1 Tax=Pseudomonas TaxID=286 RepID=UPI003CFCBD67
MPASGTTEKTVYTIVTSCLLTVCLGYIGWTWLMSPSAPVLTDVVLKLPVGENGFVYGVKDDRGGATVPFSYRYYVYRELASDEQIASELKTAGPFLVTRDPAIKINVQGSVINVSTHQEVYEYHSSTLFRHTNSADYSPVTINLCNHSSDQSTK